MKAMAPLVSTMTKCVVAICGRRRSGKDVVAAHLESKYGYAHCKVADKLKEMCKCVFGFTDEELENDSKDNKSERWGVSPREVMQFMGTEVMQFKIQELMPWVGRNFWIDTLMKDVLPRHAKVVISDVRFVHEIQRLRDQCDNVLVIKLVRGERSVSEVDMHVSETGCDDLVADHTIDNNSTIHELLSRVDDIMAREKIAV